MVAKPNSSARHWLLRALALLSLLGCVATRPALCQPASAIIPQPTSKHILFLYSYGYGSKGVEVFNETFRNTLTNAGVSVTSIYSEFLDLERNKADPEYRPRLLELLRRKYADKHIDLVITGQQLALNFLLNEGRAIAPAVPAITTLAPVPTALEAGERRIVSHSSSFDMRGTLERAMELFPNTQRIVFASGSSEADKKLAAAAAASGSAWKGKVDFEFTDELSLEDMLKRLGSLPPKTIVVFTQFNRDIAGRVGVAYEVENMIVKAANAPVFGFYDFNIYNGGIGGSVFGVSKLGESTANLALALLNGSMQLTQPITVVKSDPFPMFDWNQIQRWGGNPNNLTIQSLFVNRQPTFWEQYTLYVIGVVVFVVTQALLIIALLLSRRRRRRSEESLKRIAADLREAQLAARLGSWSWDSATDVIWWSDQLYRIYNRPLGSPPPSYVEDQKNYTPESGARLTAAVKKAMETGESYEIDLELSQEVSPGRWVLARGEARRDPVGKFTGLRGTVQEITERKGLELTLLQSKDELQRLARSMVEVRENDRRKIARELHDDLGHRLTTLSMDLEKLESKLVSNDSVIKASLLPLYGQIGEVVDAVRRIGEDLRPGMLDALGLPAAIENYVRSFSARTGIICQLTMSHDDFTVDDNMAINIFRVVQEALNNALKYAKASRIVVTLQFSEDEIALIVADNGIGMTEQAKNGRVGFGLVGMRERITALNGQLSISSEPGQGVRIEAVIPTQRAIASEVLRTPSIH